MVKVDTRYRQGVEFIALNDEPTDDCVDCVRGYLTVGLLADLFGKETEVVAQDVVAFRQREEAQIKP